MEVRTIEKLGLAVLNPLCASEGLALGAVPIAATVVGNALVKAVIVIAFFDVAAESRCPAHLDRIHDAALGGQQRPIMPRRNGNVVNPERVHVVGITMLGKLRVDATINCQNVITRIKTTVNENVLGDFNIEPEPGTVATGSFFASCPVATAPGSEPRGRRKFLPKRQEFSA